MKKLRHLPRKPRILMHAWIFLCPPAEDETSELCLGLQTLLELKVSFVCDFLIQCVLEISCASCLLLFVKMLHKTGR